MEQDSAKSSKQKISNERECFFSSSFIDIFLFLNGVTGCTISSTLAQLVFALKDGTFIRQLAEGKFLAFGDRAVI